MEGVEKRDPNVKANRLEERVVYWVFRSKKALQEDCSDRDIQCAQIMSTPSFIDDKSICLKRTNMAFTEQPQVKKTAS